MRRNYRSVLAVLYDIHGNLPALEAVLADARAQGATSFFLGGDLTGFGPFPHETLAALDAIHEPTIWIRGNGERWLREPPLDRPEVMEGLRKAVDDPRQLDEETTERLYRLPPRAEVDGVVYVHGCWHSDVDSFAVEPQDADVLRCGGLTGRTIVFGHSHLQFRRSGPNGNELVNPGSVGMPLDGDTRAAWASWDGSDFAFHRTEYDLERAVEAARTMGEWGERIVHRYTRASD
jgi:predicted phosphodiesterase